MNLTLSNKIGYSQLQYRYLINSNNSGSAGSLKENKLSDRIDKYHYFTPGVDKFYTNYPNSSLGIVGIKFDCIHSGKILVLFTNAQGQSVVKKEFEEISAYRQIATLQRGIYWLKVSDVTSHLSCVNQLFIK